MLDVQPGRILITGATGGVGGQVVELLQGTAASVTVMCRRPEQIEAFGRDGVDARLGDLGDPASLRSAMRGVHTLFLLTAGNQQQAEHGRNAVLAAMRAGVQRIVHLSTQDANPASEVPWAAAPAVTDALIQQSGLRWTLLKPSAFMQNLFVLAPALRRGLLPQTSGRGAVGWIDSADVAAVAARVLADGGHDGKDYMLTGPEALSAADIARELSSSFGQRVRYLHLPGPVFRLALRATGADQWMADGLVHQFVDVVRHGEDNARVMTDWVERITGTPATTLASFAQRHRRALLGT